MSAESGMMDDLDQPVALRRGKRRSNAISPVKPARAGLHEGEMTIEPPSTPSASRAKKRVRFSDPGQLTATSASASCGLTPYIGRTTLTTPRRRASTPASLHTVSTEIQFTPFRQVLDDRAKRRIRRNGLSEEMNAYESDRKDKAQLERELHAKDEELQNLKEQLEAAKQAGAEPGNHQTMEQLSSSQRVVEAELETLRQSFNEASMLTGFDDDGGMDINWDAVEIHKAGNTPAAAPLSDGGDTIPIYEDDADMTDPTTPARRNVNASTSTFVDTTTDEEILGMALDLEVAKQEKRQLFQNVRDHVRVITPGQRSAEIGPKPLEFQDTPARIRQDQRSDKPSFTTSTTSLPSPPKTFFADLSKAVRSTTHRAESAELALHALESDLQTLGFTPLETSSTASIIENIRSHFRQARLDLERALPGETISGLNEPGKVLSEAISKLKLLARRVQEREAELRSMHEQQRTLKSNFECGLRAAEKANQRIKELEDAVDEGADDLLNMRMKLQATEKDSVEKDHTITSLITALEKYRADVARLEGLVIQLESEQSFKIQEVADNHEEKMSDLSAQVAAEQTGRRKAEESAVIRGQRMDALQAALEAVNSDASALQIQLTALEARKVEAETALQTTHDAQLQALNTRIANLSSALTAAETECHRLHSLVVKLQSRLEISGEESTRAVESLWQEHIRSVTKSSELRKSYVRGQKVREANWRLEDERDEEGEGSGREGEGEPLTPVSLVRFVDVDVGAEDEDERLPSPSHIRGAGAEEDEDDDENHVEGRIEMSRGRSSRSRSGSRHTRSLSMTASSTRGLGIEMSFKHGARGRREKRIDSGIGMEMERPHGVDEERDEGGAGPDSLSLPPLPSSDSGFDIHEDAPSSMADTNSEVVLPSSELLVE